MAIMEPRYQSATERRSLRSKIRNMLGVSHDEAPGAVQVIRVAGDLERLMELATDGRYGVAIIDRERGEFTTWTKAIALARGEQAQGAMGTHR